MHNFLSECMITDAPIQSLWMFRNLCCICEKGWFCKKKNSVEYEKVWNSYLINSESNPIKFLISYVIVYCKSTTIKGKNHINKAKELYRERDRYLLNVWW